MTGLTTTQLAQELGLTKGRVSQLVSGGQLKGCFSGDGRQRRFDLVKCAAALNRRLDPGQMMGNGRATKSKLKQIVNPEQETLPEPQRESSPLNPADPDRYEMARTQKAEEEARRLRRQNAEADGTFVLASEVRQQVARQVGQEIAEVESMLRDAARRIADRFGIDYREARQELVQTWRNHRKGRSSLKASEAEQAEMTDEEKDMDF